MRYWVEYRKGSEAPVGVSKVTGLCRKTRKDAEPLSPKEAARAMQVYGWSTGLIPAKE